MPAKNFGIQTFGASGSGHSGGSVPDPGSAGTAIKFLREDASWADPNLSIYSQVGRAQPALNDKIAFNYSSTSAWMFMRDLLNMIRQPPGLRLTLTNGTPVTSSDVTGASTLYWTPYTSACFNFNGVFANIQEMGFQPTLTSGAVYDIHAVSGVQTVTSMNTSTNVMTFASAHGLATGSYVSPLATGGGLSIGSDYWFRSISSTTGSLHTSLAGALAGTGIVALTSNVATTLYTVTLETDAWFSTTARTTNLSFTNTIGFVTKGGDNTRMYLGTVYASGTNTMEDSKSKRFLFNFYNPQPRPMQVLETADSWTYGTASFRPWNNSTANRVEFVIGMSNSVVEARIAGQGFSSSVATFALGIGLDSTTTNNAQRWSQGNSSGSSTHLSAEYMGSPGLGYHYLQCLEKGGTGTTLYGDNAGAQQGGMIAMTWG